MPPSRPFCGALADKRIDRAAILTWLDALGRKPTAEELEALVRFARVVEGYVRNQAQKYGLELAGDADVLEVEARLGEPELERARERRLAADLFLAFGRFARDPIDSARRARSARARIRSPLERRLVDLGLRQKDPRS